MKAAVLRGAGIDFAVEELRLRALGPHDVHVEIAASGVCHSDLSIQDGTIPHPLPAVLGHEGAGVVLATGAEVSTVAAGDHVVLAWVAPCRRVLLLPARASGAVRARPRPRVRPALRDRG